MAERRLLASFALLSSLGLGIAGCAETAPPAPPPDAAAAPAPAPAGITVDDSANGTSVKMPVGETLTVRLSGASGSTGYHWLVLRGSGLWLTLESQTMEPDAPPPAPGAPPMLGGSATTVLVFKAKRPGFAIVRAALYPPGNRVRVAKIYRLKVAITRH
jgi:predicted secreted protein